VTPPVFWYRDPAVWARERSGVFAGSWQFFTHESALGEAGRWVAETIAGFPVLVIRDGAGELRGYHNVCRHRAGPLTGGESGRCDGEIVCRYHGWRYAYDGRLKLARDFGAATDFDPRAWGLFSVRVETWRGLVFVAMTDKLAPLSEWVAPLESRLTGADWSDLAVALRRSHPIACNWKTYVENYLEGYHVPAIHPELDAEIDSARYVVRMEGAVALHEAPLRRPDAVYGGLWGWLWPNLGLNVYGRGLMLERISPHGPTATTLEYVYLAPEGEKIDAAILAMSDAVTAQDKEIVERVQENLDAGVYEGGPLSPKHEGALAAFHALLGRSITPA
jgi:choline monooxygenase